MTDENKDNDLDSLLGQDELEDWDQELGEGLEEDETSIPGLEEEYTEYPESEQEEEVEQPVEEGSKPSSQVESTDEDEIPAKVVTT